MSKYQLAKEEFSAANEECDLVIDKVKGYVPVQLPVVESTAPLKSVSEIAETCHIPAHRVTHHITGTYTHREILHRHLTTICEFIQSGKLSDGKQKLLIDKLQEGAPNCTPGFMNRAQDCILGLKRPQNMLQLLACYRRFLVEKARAPVSDEVHANQQFLSEANAMGLAIPDQGVQDVYAGGILKGTVRKHIRDTFQADYTVEKIEQNLFDSIFAHYGYCGRKSAASDYKNKVTGPIFDAFKQLMEKSEVTPYDLFVWEENEKGLDVIVDINMDFVAAQVREYLLRTGFFVKKPVGHKLKLAVGDVALRLDTQDVARSVFRITNGDDEQYFFIKDAHEFAGSFPDNFFQLWFVDQEVDMTAKNGLLVLAYLQGLVVDVNLVKALLPNYFARELESAKCVEEAIQYLGDEGRKVCIESMLPIFPKLKDSMLSYFSKAKLIAYLAELDPTLQSDQIKETVVAVTDDFTSFRFTAADMSLDLYRVYLSSLKGSLLRLLDYPFMLDYLFNSIGLEKAALFLDELGDDFFTLFEDKWQYLKVVEGLQEGLRSLFLVRLRSILTRFDFNQSEVIKLASYAVNYCHGEVLVQVLFSLIKTQEQLQSLLPTLDDSDGSAVLQVLLSRWDEKVGGYEKTLSLLSVIDAQATPHLYSLLEAKLCEQITDVQAIVQVAAVVDDAGMERIFRLMMGRLPEYVRSSQDFYTLFKCLNEKSQVAVLIVLMASPQSFIKSVSDLRRVEGVLSVAQQRYFQQQIVPRLPELFDGQELLMAKACMEQYALLDSEDSIDKLINILIVIPGGDVQHVLSYLGRRLSVFVKTQDDLHRLLNILFKCNSEEVISFLFSHIPDLVNSFLQSSDYKVFYTLFKQAAPRWKQWMIAQAGNNLAEKLALPAIWSLNQILNNCDTELKGVILQQLQDSGDLSKIVSTPDDVLIITHRMSATEKRFLFGLFEKSPVILQSLAAVQGGPKTTAIARSTDQFLRADCHAAAGSRYKSVQSGINQIRHKAVQLRQEKEGHQAYVRNVANRSTLDSFVRDMRHFGREADRALYLQTLGRAGLMRLLDSRGGFRASFRGYRTELLKAYIAIRKAESGRYLLTTHLSTIFRFLLPDKKKKLSIAHSLLNNSCKHTLSGGLLGMIDSRTRSVRC